jgi:hypothetical protein
MSTRLFAQYDLSAVLNTQTEKVRKEIDACDEDYILNVSENDFVEHLFSKYTIAAPQLGEPYMLEPKEVDVDVGNDPMYGIRRGHNRCVKGCQVDIRIPFSGERELFFCRPPSFRMSAPLANVDQDYLSLVYASPGELQPDAVKSFYERELEEIRFYLSNVKVECNGFNSSLKGRILQALTGRKSRLLKNRKASLNIGIPLYRRENAQQTYVVPGITRKPEIQRPLVKEKAFAPEPVLVEQEYENILSIIRSMVSVMERSPKAFIHMGEEDLRTHFLVQLNGQYQGRATGETFNYQGKTDILIREGDRNIFISECKIWKGEGELLRAIDQILGYLHWRDTKTALLIFNRNKSFSEVLSKVLPAVEGHACYKSLIRKVSETEWRFLFRNPDDANRELQLAVIIFDIPKEAA